MVGTDPDRAGLSRLPKRTPCRLGGELGAGVDVELREDVFEVGLDGGPAHEQSLGDLGVGEPFGDEGDHLLFGGSEAGPAVVGTLPLASGAAGVGGGFAPVETAALGFRRLRRVAERRQPRRRVPRSTARCSKPNRQR